jgi:hypothetical protein
MAQDPKNEESNENYLSLCTTFPFGLIAIAKAVTENLSSVFKELKIRGQIFLVKFYLK